MMKIDVCLSKCTCGEIQTEELMSMYISGVLLGYFCWAKLFWCIYRPSKCNIRYPCDDATSDLKTVFDFFTFQSYSAPSF